MIVYTKGEFTYNIDDASVVFVCEGPALTIVTLTNGTQFELDNTNDAVTIAAFKTAVAA